MYTKKSPSASLFLATTLLLLLLLVVAANACFPACSHPPNLPTPTTATPKGSCPRDALKLGVCAKLLNGSVGTVVGSPPDAPCCSVLGGLLDLEAAVCLCTALKANVLGINIDIPISLSLLVNTCGKELPSDFICA